MVTDARFPTFTDTKLTRYLPGIVISLIVSGSVYTLHDVVVIKALSPIIVAILLGMVMSNTAGLPERAEAGVSFCAKTLLRLTVMMLGAQVTFADLVSLGPWGIFAAVSGIILVMWAGSLLGRVMGLPRELTALISAGTAICGASAIAAVNSVTQSKAEQVSYAIGIITIFGTISMLCYPMLRPLLGLDAQQYGLWVGLSLHEVAQVVGAGFAEGEVAGKAAVTAKLARVLMLSMVVTALARGFRNPNMALPNSQKSSAPLVPWFLCGFLMLALVNSLGLIPAPVHEALNHLRPILTVIAMAAIGLSTRLDKLFGLGASPLILGLVLSLLIALFSLSIAFMMT